MAAIQYPRHCLPQYFDQPYATEFAAPLWDQEKVLKGSLFRKETLKKGGLDQVDNHHPLRGVWRFLPSGLPQPVPKVLRPHSVQSS